MSYPLCQLESRHGSESVRVKLVSGSDDGLPTDCEELCTNNLQKYVNFEGKQKTTFCLKSHSADGLMSR